MVNKNSRWQLTQWSKKPVVERMELVSFLIYQKEYKEGGKEHYQGYVEFYKPYSRTQVKSLFKDSGMHVEEADKSIYANIWYCTKPESFAGYRYMYNACDCQYEYDADALASPTPERAISWKDIISSKPDLFDDRYRDYKEILKKHE